MRRGKPTPNGEESLEDKPHGDPVEDGSETEGLGEVEGAEDDLGLGAGSLGHVSTHPVGQPLLVVVGAGRLDGLDREVGGKGPTDEVGDGLGEAEDVEEDQGDGAEG